MKSCEYSNESEMFLDEAHCNIWNTRGIFQTSILKIPIVNIILYNIYWILTLYYILGKTESTSLKLGMEKYRY